MKISVWAILVILFVTSTCLKVHAPTPALTTPDHEDYQQLKTGGYTEHTPGPNDKPIDSFIKAKFPELQDAQLVKIQRQVVNGWNNRFRYSKNGEIWTVTVFEDTDGHYQVMGVTKSGKKVSRDGQEMEVKYEAKLQNRGILDVANQLFSPQK